MAAISSEAAEAPLLMNVAFTGTQVMVQDRKEPTLSGIKPERDEITTHQSRMQKKAAPQKTGSRPSAPRPAPSSGGKGLAVFGILLALIGIGAGGFGLWQWQLSQQELGSMTGRVEELEARLNLTNSESDQSVTKILEKLEWADSEIRKLWGVSNDRNKKSIAANAETIKQIKTTATKLEKDLTAAVEAQKTAVASVKTLTNEQQLVLTQLEDDISAAKKQLQSVKDLTARIATNEEAIKAIDAFRRSTNADIQQIKSQMSGSGAGAATIP